MKVLNQIDSLIQNLQSLKPLLSEDTSSNRLKFNEVLASSLEEREVDFSIGKLEDEPQDEAKTIEESPANISNNTSINNATDKMTSSTPKTNVVPDWVNPDYPYDIDKPRKPNMRELMEAISGKKMQDLYSDKNSNWQDLSSTASELLYGVLGPNIPDTRDWNAIMKSADITTAARLETNKLVQPQIDISTELDVDNKIKDQYAVLKSSAGNTLKVLNGGADSVQKILDNYDVKFEAIAEGFEDKIVIDDFDQTILSLIKNLPKTPVITTNSNALNETNNSLETLALNSQLTNVASNSAQQISLEEFIKL